MVDQQDLRAAEIGNADDDVARKCAASSSLRPAPGSSIIITRGAPTVARAISTMRRSQALRSRAERRGRAGRRPTIIERPADQIVAASGPPAGTLSSTAATLSSDAEILDHLLVLERAADAEGGALMRPRAERRRRPSTSTRPAEGATKPREDVEQRRLAGAVRPDEAGDRLGQLGVRSLRPRTPPNWTVRPSISIIRRLPFRTARRARAMIRRGVRDLARRRPAAR